MFWVRARGYIGEGDMKMHCCVAAYISDYAFLGTAVLPHQWQHKVHFMVSLDHSMWFHAPSELTTGCSMSARAPGLVALGGWSMGGCGVRMES